MIGTLSKAGGRTAGMNCVISTGDKDLAQLVTGQNHAGQHHDRYPEMDAEGVREKFGVDPSQIIDYLALTGDKSDNIPGVEKCGPKTAAKWLAQMALAGRGDRTCRRGRWKKLVKTSVPRWIPCRCPRELTTIRSATCPWTCQPTELELNEPDEEGLRVRALQTL